MIESVSAFLPWVLFLIGVVVFLALDLGVIHRKDEVMSVSSALKWSAFWVALSLAFAVFVWLWHGAVPAQEFLAGYLIEKALSVDNLFVFVLVFSALGITAKFQHKVLFWGVLGALVMRAVFIFGGIALLERFHWVIYVFGALLIYTGIKMWKSDETEMDVEANPVVRLAERFLPVDCTPDQDRFFVVKNGVRMATPLFLALIAVESADLVFAIDSVPAVLAISRDPFIVFTSNVFAIMGLRSLYFALAGCVERFHYLHYGLSVVLGFVGAKMLLVDVVHLPVGLSIGFIIATVGASIGYSLYKTRDGACEVPAAEPHVVTCDSKPAAQTAE